MEQQQNAKFAFFYLLSLVALIFMSISVGIIIFQIINRTIPDALTLAPGDFSQDALRFAISAIIIAAPIYFTMMRLINRSLLAGLMEKESGIRKWLTYFILLVSAVVMIGWLIATINSFLNGELTLKFILKALTSVLISAAIFSYYLYDIRREDVSRNNQVIRAYYYGALAVVAVTLVASFFFVDSPAEVRNQRYDQAIINKFSQIDSALTAYYGENSELPAQLSELINNGSRYFILESDLIDPSTNQPFDYQVISSDTYELCSTFKTSNKDQADKGRFFPDPRWLHDAGYKCLRQRVVILDNSGKPLKPLPVR
ncbi:MAG: DUF5671 domain-containing protein [bacterium]|nr:DUF5671 domain-containing protein [bacterium]